MELVYTSINVSSQQYKDVYGSTLQPILLAQPGLVLDMAGVITTDTDQQETQESDKVISLVIWKSVDAHMAFIAGPAAIPFFEASKPLMSTAPLVEHYETSVLQPPAVESRYTRLLKAYNDNDKELLAKIHEKHAATEGAEMAASSDSVEDASQRTLILFSNSNKFEAAADASNGNTTIKSTTIEWYSRGFRSEE